MSTTRTLRVRVRVPGRPEAISLSVRVRCRPPRTPRRCGAASACDTHTVAHHYAQRVSATAAPKRGIFVRTQANSSVAQLKHAVHTRLRALDALPKGCPAFGSHTLRLVHEGATLCGAAGLPVVEQGVVHGSSIIAIGPPPRQARSLRDGAAALSPALPWQPSRHSTPVPRSD